MGHQKATELTTNARENVKMLTNDIRRNGLCVRSKLGCFHFFVWV